MKQFMVYQCERKPEGMIVHKLFVQQDGPLQYRTVWVRSFRLAGNLDPSDYAERIWSGQQLSRTEIEKAACAEKTWDDRIMENISVH